jgi:paraquat-inducible protein B
MSEKNKFLGETEDLPDVVVKKQKGIPLIWLIPVVAAIIGASLAYKTITEKGPTITITFKSGDGLEEGKTKIKYKAVDIGVVEKIDISPDMSHVIVTAELRKSAEPYCNDGTRLWVVRPHISATEITGLETLVSGVYIEVDPGQGNPSVEFTGLEDSPIIRADSPGKEFILKAQALGSLKAGSPIIYRGIEAGQVLGYEMTDDGQTIQVPIYINEPFDKLVHPNTKFWNLSGFDVSITADGVKMKTASLGALLAGGIAFETPENSRDSQSSEAGSFFPLFNSREDSNNLFTRSIDLIMYFENSVRGLKVGAPVEFKGIKVGFVKDLRMEFHQETLEMRIPVTIQIQPERVITIGNKPVNPRKRISGLINRGLKARLKTGSLLTGQLFIEMDLLPEIPIKRVGGDSPYLEIPTIPSTLDEITKTTTEILADIKNLPLEDLINNMILTVKNINHLVESPEIMETLISFNKSLDQVQGLVGKIDGEVEPISSALRQTAKNADSALQHGTMTLKEIEGFISENSPLRVDLTTSLEELSAAARSMRLLADYLERHPEALVHGKAGPRRK